MKYALIKLTPIKDSHGLQCALVVANILPEAELLLVNIPRDSASQGLATMIENDQKDQM